MGGWANAATIRVPADVPRIQDAISRSVTGDTIIVSEGVYAEYVQFGGKNITLAGSNPDDWGVVSRTIIQPPSGANAGPVVQFSGTESPTCVLAGLTIQNGKDTGIRGNNTLAAISRCWVRNNTSSGSPGGIHVVQGLVDRCRITGNSGLNVGGIGSSKGVISNCLIADNLGSDIAGGLYNCTGPIVHCTIVNNRGLQGTGGINGCSGVIANCIIWGNTTYDSDEKIIISNKVNSSQPFTSCFYNAIPQNGNINIDPQLGPGYSLKAGSPCIDTGMNIPPIPLSGWDLRGGLRAVDGNGDSMAVTDMGVIEYDPDGISLAADPERLDFGAAGGAAANSVKTFDLYNLDGYSGNWQLDTNGCQWITADPVGGTLAQTAQSITIRVNPAGLVQGDYHCDLNIIADGMIRAVVPVVLHVGNIIRVPQDAQMVQTAIDRAVDWDTIIVSPGTYRENLNFLGKKILLRGVDPMDWNTVKTTILDGQNSGPCITFNKGEGNDSIIEGLTLQLGTGTNINFGPFGGNMGGGILCLNSSPTIRRCQICWNGYYIRTPWLDPGRSVSTLRGGGIALMGNCQAQIKDCLMLGNAASFRGAGIYAYPNPGRESYAQSRIERCTFVRNYAWTTNIDYPYTFSVDGSSTLLQIRNSICWDFPIQTTDPSQVEYCCLHRFYRYNSSNSNYPVREEIAGINGNIDCDPRFVVPFDYSNPTLFDFRLQSASPCINHGDPGFVGIETRDLNGQKRVMDGRLDIGAFEFVPEVGVDSPKAGDVWQAGNEYNLSWTQYRDSIALSNPGFEQTYMDIIHDVFITLNDVDVGGWTIGPESGVAYLPAKFDSMPNPQGEFTAFDRGSGVYQLLVDHYRPNCRYTLKLYVGNRIDSSPITNWQAALTADNRTSIATAITQEQCGIPGLGKWIEVSLTLDTGAEGVDTNVGKRIGILLTGAPRVHFDEVSLEFTELVPTTTVDVDLSLDNGQTWETITNDWANTGSYLWTIPSDLAAEYSQIRVVSNRPDCIAVPSGTFSIRPGCSETLVGDIVPDCKVNMEDLLVLTAAWLSEGCTEPQWCNGSDLNRDSRVALDDLALLAESWMK
jgi:hypothetical protein